MHYDTGYDTLITRVLKPSDSIDIYPDKCQNESRELKASSKDGDYDGRWRASNPFGCRLITRRHWNAKDKMRPLANGSRKNAAQMTLNAVHAWFWRS